MLTISIYLKIEVKEPSLSSSASLASLLLSLQGFPLTVQAQIDFELHRHRLLSNALSLQNRTQSEPGLLPLEQSQLPFSNELSQRTLCSGFDLLAVVFGVVGATVVGAVTTCDVAKVLLEVEVDDVEVSVIL